MSHTFEEFVASRRNRHWTLLEATARAEEISSRWPDSKIDHDDGVPERWFSVISRNTVVALIFTDIRFGLIEIGHDDAPPDDFFPVTSLDAAELTLSENLFSSAFGREPPDGMNLQKFSALDLYALTAT